MIDRFVISKYLQAKLKDAGLILSDVIRRYMSDLKIENGLAALGFTADDIGNLVQGALPQVQTENY